MNSSNDSHSLLVMNRSVLVRPYFVYSSFNTLPMSLSFLYTAAVSTKKYETIIINYYIIVKYPSTAK